MTPRYERVQLRASSDREGVILFDGEVLVAVLARLGEHHGASAGRWFIEFMPGMEGLRLPEPFAALSDAVQWIEGLPEAH